METTDPRQPCNSCTERRPNLNGSAVGCISEARVDSIGVAVGDVVTEEPAKVVLVQHDDMINEFALAGSDPSFRAAKGS